METPPYLWLFLCRLTHLLDNDRDESVVNEHPGPDGHDLGDVFVVHPQHALAALLHVLIVRGDLDFVPGCQGHLRRRSLCNQSKKQKSAVWPIILKINYYPTIIQGHLFWSSLCNQSKNTKISAGDQYLKTQKLSYHYTNKHLLAQAPWP